MFLSCYLDDLAQVERSSHFEVKDQRPDNITYDQTDRRAKG